MPDDNLLPTAWSIAAEIVENTFGVSVALARQMLWSMLSEPSPRTAYPTQSSLLLEAKLGPDPTEGRASFLGEATACLPGSERRLPAVRPPTELGRRGLTLRHEHRCQPYPPG